MSEQTVESTPRTPEEIEAALEATRLELTATVDELVAQLQPANLVAMAKDDLGRRYADAKVRAVKTVEAARAGDSDALRKLGLAAVGAVGVVTFLVWRFRR